MKLATILSVLALLGAGASAYFFLSIKGQKEALIVQRDGLQADLSQSQNQVARLTTEVDDLQNRNRDLDREVGEVKQRNTSLEARMNQMTADLTKTRTDLTTSQNSLTKANEEIATLRDQVVSLRARVADGEGNTKEELVKAYAELAELQTKVREYEAILAQRYREGDPIPLINADIVTVGPRSAFVVLSAGKERGVKEMMKFAIERAGQIIAQGTVTTVQDNLAVAEIIPNTLVSEPVVGDLAYSVY